MNPGKQLKDPAGESLGRFALLIGHGSVRVDQCLAQAVFQGGIDEQTDSHDY